MLSSSYQACLTRRKASVRNQKQSAARTLHRPKEQSSRLGQTLNCGSQRPATYKRAAVTVKASSTFENTTTELKDVQPKIGTDCYVEVKKGFSAEETEAAVRAGVQHIEQEGYVVIRTGETDVDPMYMETVCKSVMEVDPQIGWASYNGGGGVFRPPLFPDGSTWISAAEGAPKKLPVEFHNEMAYANTYPSRIAFGMFACSEDYVGGETRLCDDVLLTELLDNHPELYEKMKTLGVQYVRNLKDKEDSDLEHLTSWQGAFLVNDWEEAKDLVAKNPHNVLKADTSPLQQRTWRPLFHKHPVLDKDLLFCSILNRHATWFEQPGYAEPDQTPVPSEEYAGVPLNERPYHMLWGDGSELTTEEINVIRHLHAEAEIRVKLNAGDVLIADNLRLQHGRMPWKGSVRQLGLLISGMVDRAELPGVSSTPPVTL
eukprot:CAMPEP_0197850592 /NCGR_PEP_ID=MMETSP1438-20131217/15793_1 /TAXON_ID=1461541 /ORGANISM="Pterosperma sp., Strain CCMP1384" /LENGTH=429 /DNA_ID=CAMNT_0043463827 /DNA_START=126 /DNA_END=1415 /DNA_ORIENTATION=+